jgi:hypothetical protein
MDCKREILNINTIISEENIYPCKNNNCNNYHKSCYSHSLIDAIYFLQLERVKELLANNDDIINIKVWKRNLLEYIMNEMKGKWTKEIDALGFLDINKITNPNYVINDIEKNILYKIKKIIYYLLERCPELSTSKLGTLNVQCVL